jgi:HK97 gp10 family phage protein
MKVNFKITGHKEIDKVLAQLSPSMNHKLFQKAHTSAAKQTVDAAKLLAPEGPTGGLIDSIGVEKAPFSKANDLGEVNIGARRGRYKGYAAHLVEFGTGKRTLDGKGKYRAGTSRGVMPKKPFLEPAWERTKNGVQESITTHLARHVFNFMKRTIKATGR